MQSSLNFSPVRKLDWKSEQKGDKKMEKEKEMISKKKEQKTHAISYYQDNEKKALEVIVRSLAEEEQWYQFWYDFKEFKIYKELEFDTLQAYVEDRFKSLLSKYGSVKTKEYKKARKRIINRLDYLASQANPKIDAKKKESKSKTDLQKGKEIADKLNVDDLIILRDYVESLLSAAESIEEESEDNKIQKAA